MNIQSLPKVDAHTHLFYDQGSLAELLAAWHLQAVVVNITGEGLFEAPMAQRWQAMQDLKKAHPRRFALCASFDPAEVVAHGTAERAVTHLQHRLQQGASLVKVWKDVGLSVRDDEGRYVQIDDARFQPIWDFLAGAGVPVLVHVAEPRAAWEPLDRQSPHYRYYRDHPEHHLYQRDEVPSWERIIAARDRWLERNPDLTVVGAHFGSMAHDVDLVAERLERYPNFYVDTAERFGDLVVQPSGKVRRFLTRYADRVLYGTDVIAERPAGAVAEPERRRQHEAYADLLAQHARYFAGGGTVEVQDKLVEPVRIEALGLPDDVLAQVYGQNARRLYGLPEVP